MRASVRWLVLPALLLLAAGRQPCALGQPLPDDLDGDGVVDAVDACPATAAGDLVDAAGCSVCPCGGPREGGEWASRSVYYLCVVLEARTRRDEGTLDRRAYREAIRHARLSSCGVTAFTRCCYYRRDDDLEGRCRITPPERCDAELMHLTGAADLGPGSCLPHPCSLE